MIKEKPQGTMPTRGRNASDLKGTFDTHCISAKHYRSRMRRGLSQRVLNSAERLMKEYQPDLDYLKDR